MQQQHMTAQEFRQRMAQEQTRKYRNVKTEVDGITFDSRAEADRYCELKMLLAAGKISGFDIQPSFVLDVGVRYRPDFIVCGNDGVVWVEDVKGVETQAFKLKRKLWEQRYPWMELRVIGGAKHDAGKEQGQ